MCLFTDEQREIGQNCNIYKLPYVCNFLLGYMFFFFFFFLSTAILLVRHGCDLQVYIYIYIYNREIC